MQNDEKRDTRAEHRALMLFDRIMADLFCDNFSLEEIWDEFGRHAGTADDPFHHTQCADNANSFWNIKPEAEVVILVRLGCIEADGQNPGVYRVTEKGYQLASQE